MRRTLTILVVGLLVAGLAIGGIATAASAHGDDTEQSPYADGYETENATDAYAAMMAEWMTARMGPDGVEAFEQETGTTVEVVAHAMAEQMGPAAGTWNDSAGTAQYGPGWGGGYQAPGSGYGPGMYGPGMHGPGMHGQGMHHGGHMGPAWGYGPSAGEGSGLFGGPGMFGGQSGQYGGQGYSPSQGPGMFGGQGQGFFGGFGPGNWFGSGGGHGSYGGHGMGGGMGGMGGGW
ncbi:MAG: hypothetical protein U5K70_02225 [Halodesulfurarchaeum sp.]|nr:hypothetical protein [Halodesulfurarchaeum sp.]